MIFGERPNMFNFFKKKPLFEFYTNNPAALKHHPVQPVSNELSKILKKVKRDETETSIKKCPGIIHYNKLGYIVYAWQDIEIETEDNAEAFSWKTPLNINDFETKIDINGPTLSEIMYMKPELFYNYFPRPDTLKCVIKINTPWSVKMPDGYSLIYAPFWYDNETRFSVIPGLFDSNEHNYLNVQIYWHVIGGKEIIRAGTPLVRLIPIKNEDFDFVSRMSTREENLEYKMKMYQQNKGIYS